MRVCPLVTLGVGEALRLRLSLRFQEAGLVSTLFQCPERYLLAALVSLVLSSSVKFFISVIILFSRGSAFLLCSPVFA